MARLSRTHLSGCRPPRIVAAEPIGPLQLRVTFSDGLVRDLNLDPCLRGGVLEDLRAGDVFAAVQVDPVAGTVTWPGGIDLDPDVLHGDHTPLTGAPPVVLNEYRLRPTA